MAILASGLGHGAIDLLDGRYGWEDVRDELVRLLSSDDPLRTLLTCQARVNALAGRMGEHSTRIADEAWAALIDR
ncbi:MAG: hypothetical protein K8M05_23735 [Deltaproteobacteria bacterium]|nr:hypothetical protein [Kofleriaceae bacterium]